jgi:hypothetical protein
MAKKKSSKVASRWEQASAELERAKSSTPEDTRYAWEIAEEDLNLPSYETLVPEEISKSQYIIKTAPTRKSERPRAHTIAYNPTEKSLMIIFRTGFCAKYENISVDMWLALRDGDSTNDFITSALNGLPYQPCDRNELSDSINEQLTYMTEKASRIQKGQSLG